MKTPKPQGIQVAIICLVFGVVAAAPNVVAYFNGKVFPKLLVLAPGLILASVAFFILPGTNPPPEVPEKERIKHWWKHSPAAHKAAWLASAAAGLGIGFWITFSITKF